MKTIYSPDHAAHSPARELGLGEFTGNFEKPERALFVLEEVRRRALGPIEKPEKYGLDDILRVHDPAYVEFLQTAHEQWRAQGHEGDAFAFAFNVQHPYAAHKPSHIYARLGQYTADGTVPVTPTSWQAVRESAFTALTGAGVLADGAGAAFALCRPPGHHATAAAASGYCFINNAALAAQALIDGGAGRVAVLDVDYHHGNGTQDIFYDRRDVLFLSIHADPAREYPYFIGYADETGVGAGEGYTVNYPLPFGTAYDSYGPVLAEALAAVRRFGPEALVVSLGVDTYKNDPISRFRLESPDFLRIGSAIAGVGVPTLFVMEGGYAIAEVGTNAANVLTGFLEKA